MTRTPLVALLLSALAVGCAGDDTNPAAPAQDASVAGADCTSPLLSAAGDAGSCTTCLQQGCFAQVSSVLSATAAACSAAQAALAICASGPCGPACGGSLGATTLDAGAALSATCQAYVRCCVASNASLLDAGISLGSVQLSCEQNASLDTDAQCATLAAQMQDAGVVCP
jgi:hypothetical protein